MIECGEFAVTLHDITRSYNKMKDEDKPIPMNRIKAVLAEKQVSAKQLCIAVGKMKQQYPVGVIIKFNHQSVNFKK